MYLIIARAEWVSGHQNPPDFPDTKRKVSRILRKEFGALTNQRAERKARHFLIEFKKKLPKEDKGCLSWTTKPKIVSIIFAKLLPF